jgi:uncharacterized protein with HEPN domain
MGSTFCSASPGLQTIPLPAVTPLQDAIIRNLQVLASLCEGSIPFTETPMLIDWKAIAGMRNVLVLGYFDVDFEALWDVVTTISSL